MLFFSIPAFHCPPLLHPFLFDLLCFVPPLAAGFSKVMGAIYAAVSVQSLSVKINCVLMRGTNEMEIGETEREGRRGEDRSVRESKGEERRGEKREGKERREEEKRRGEEEIRSSMSSGRTEGKEEG